MNDQTIATITAVAQLLVNELAALGLSAVTATPNDLRMVVNVRIKPYGYVTMWQRPESSEVYVTGFGSYDQDDVNGRLQLSNPNCLVDLAKILSQHREIV